MTIEDDEQIREYSRQICQEAIRKTWGVIGKAVFDPKNYGVVIIDNADSPDLSIHHRSCALRSGGTECTC